MIEAKRIFVTGASGFIGRSLVEQLVVARCRDVVCLSRHAEVRNESWDGAEVQWVRGDLLRPGSYQNKLRDSDVVIHLGASTGNHTAAEYRQVNFEGTKGLIASCHEVGVKRFIFVSTVAAGYGDLHDYPYALAKRDAEEAVKGSGLEATIVRPTLVLGPGSRIGESLLKFARLPLVPVLGDGNAMIQPIHVDDVARGLVELVADRTTIGETIELGGREVLNWNEWFRRARRITGKGIVRPLHVPLWLILPILRGLERIAEGKLPVTAGQLSVFRHDSSIEVNSILNRIRDDMRDVDSMIADSMPADKLNRSEVTELDRECEIFAQHLINQSVSEYLFEEYRRAHEKGGPLSNEPTSFDNHVLRFARRGGWRLSVADAYARMFIPTGILRRKLVLAMALLENSADGADRFNLEKSVRPITGMFQIIGWGMRYVVLLIFGVALFGPRHLIGGGR